MSSQVTDWGAGALLAVLLAQASAPSQFWVALAGSEPGTAADGDSLADLEPPGAAGYARQSIATGGTAWSDPTDTGYATNLTAIDFGVPTADWGALTHYVLCTAETGGQIWCYGEFDVPAHGSATWNISLPAGALRLQAGSADATVVAG